MAFTYREGLGRPLTYQEMVPVPENYADDKWWPEL